MPTIVMVWIVNVKNVLKLLGVNGTGLIQENAMNICVNGIKPILNNVKKRAANITGHIRDILMIGMWLIENANVRNTRRIRNLYGHAIYAESIK